MCEGAAKLCRMKYTKKKRAACLGIRLLVGCGIGLLNGFFGSGGGVLAVEAITRLGESEKRAHASAILAILPLSIASAVVYALHGNIPWGGDTWMLLAGGAGGGLLGALALDKLPPAWVNLLFTGLILLAGLRMLLF